MESSKETAIANARLLTKQLANGVLSTHSKANEGFPFGSVSTHISTTLGDIVFYISDLAQHTKNLLSNPKMSFTLYQSSDNGNSHTKNDPNANSRLTLLGNAEPIHKDDPNYNNIQNRFFAIHPSSRKYQNAHNFEFFKLSVSRARFIGGFGDIHWISEESWRPPVMDWQDKANQMIQHMNDDHVDAMKLISTYFAHIDPKTIVMVGLEPDGAYYQVDTMRTVFIPFGTTCKTSKDVRIALVAQTNEARGKLTA